MPKAIPVVPGDLAALGREPLAAAEKGSYHCASLCLYGLEWDGFVLALQVKHKRLNRPPVINSPCAAASVFRSGCGCD